MSRFKYREDTNIPASNDAKKHLYFYIKMGGKNTHFSFKMTEN